jgi:hypothetical protein
MGRNFTQRPGGRSGIAGKRGGMRIHVANIRSSGAGKNTTVSSWARSNSFRSNTVEGPRFGAHFSSVRNRVRQRWLITGITRDSSGAVLGNCQVVLFKTIDNMPCCITTSDANGYYEFSIDGNTQARFAVSYKTGSPDVAGTTVNTLVPVLT